MGAIWRWDHLDYLSLEEWEWWRWHPLPRGWAIIRGYEDDYIAYKEGDMKEELRIVYKIKERIDPDLDKALGDLLEQYGWHCWASGVNHITGERDMAFDREEVVDTSGFVARDWVETEVLGRKEEVQ